MKVSEGWRRTFIVLSGVYWLLALFASVNIAMIEGGPYKIPVPIHFVLDLMVSAVIYGVLAGLVAGVVWIILGFGNSKPADE